MAKKGKPAKFLNIGRAPGRNETKLSHISMSLKNSLPATLNYERSFAVCLAPPPPPFLHRESHGERAIRATQSVHSTNVYTVMERRGGSYILFFFFFFFKLNRMDSLSSRENSSEGPATTYSTIARRFSRQQSPRVGWLQLAGVDRRGSDQVCVPLTSGYLKRQACTYKRGGGAQNDAGLGGRRRRAGSHGGTQRREVGREAARPTVDVWLLLKLKISIPIRTPGFIEAQFVSLLEDNTYSSRGQ